MWMNVDLCPIAQLNTKIENPRMVVVPDMSVAPKWFVSICVAVALLLVVVLVFLNTYIHNFF